MDCKIQNDRKEEKRRKKVVSMAVAIWFILSRVIVGCHTLRAGVVLVIDETAERGVTSPSSSESELGSGNKGFLGGTTFCRS